jgi:hypothetical protein
MSTVLFSLSLFCKKILPDVIFHFLSNKYFPAADCHLFGHYELSYVAEYFT